MHGNLIVFYRHCGQDHLQRRKCQGVKSNSMQAVYWRVAHLIMNAKVSCEETSLDAGEPSNTSC